MTTIEELVHAGASGAVATRAGSPSATSSAAARDETWGPNVWVEAAGHAVERARGRARSLRARRGALDRGRPELRTTRSCRLNESALVDAWFRVGFGHQHVHALREAPGDTGHGVVPPGVVIRRPRRDDIDALADARARPPAHQQLSPVFSAAPPPSLEEAAGRVGRGLRQPGPTRRSSPKSTGASSGRRSAARSTHFEPAQRASLSARRGGASRIRSGATRGARRRGSATRSERRCSTGRRPRATAPSRPTGARRICSRRARGRSSPSGRRSTASSRGIV